MTLYVAIGVLISALAGVFHYTVDASAVATAISAVVAVAAPLVAAIKARAKVTPVAK